MVADDSLSSPFRRKQKRQNQKKSPGQKQGSNSLGGLSPLPLCIPTPLCSLLREESAGNGPILHCFPQQVAARILQQARNASLDSATTATAEVQAWSRYILGSEVELNQ